MTPSAEARFALKSRRVVLPGQAVPGPAVIVIDGGRIESVTAGDAAPKDAPVEDLGDLVVLPGGVDTHAHINEPGRTDWEGFATATAAAAAGGVTTVVDMPLNSIPATTSLAALNTKAESAAGQCRIDYGFWGGIIPGNSAELAPMIDAGIMGFKCFLIESGVDEFPMVGEAELRRAMPILASRGVPLLVHAELESPVSVAAGNPKSYGRYVASRPQRWEVDAIRMVIKLAAEFKCMTHIVHLSAGDALADIVAARAAGVPLTAETCPHYLAFTAEEIPDGATHYKCAPPIREAKNRERLWQGLAEGSIEFVVSDHSPCTPQLKLMDKGDFDHAWGGIAGLQFARAVTWTEMQRRGLGWDRLARWTSEAPATFAGLKAKKGRIAAGQDADLVVFDDKSSFTLTAAMVKHRHSVTPYAGRQLSGVVRRTYLRGGVIFQEGQLPMTPRGHQLFRHHKGEQA